MKKKYFTIKESCEMKKIKNASKVIDDAWEAGREGRGIAWEALKSIDPNSRGIFAVTPLMVAAKFGRGNEHHVRDMLQAEGVDVNAVDESGWSALTLACYSSSSSVEIVRILLEAGADHSFETKYGEFALQCAHDNSEYQEYLLRVITVRLRTNQMETLLLGHISGNVSERVREDFSDGLRQTTALRHLRLYMAVDAPFCLKENYSVTRVSVIKYDWISVSKWARTIVKRNRRAFVRCQRAARCLKRGFKSLLGKDVANLISEFVLRTAGEKIWACVE